MASSTTPTTSLQQLQQPPELQALIKKAASDLASLNRVSHRLAMTEDTRLASILDKLLPRLLKRIGENQHQLSAWRTTMAETATSNPSSSSSREAEDDNCASAMLLKGKLDQIHTKLVEMLSHIMKRIKADDNCELPCLEILQQILSSPLPPSGVAAVELQDPFTINLSLAFLTVGLPRMKQPQQLLPSLMLGLGSYCCTNTAPSSAAIGASYNMQEQQGDQLAHLLLRCLERIVRDEQELVLRHDDQFLAACHQLLLDPSNASTASQLYSLMLDVMLYHPVPSLGASNNNTATTTTTTSIPPDGLSQRGTQRLVKGHSYTERDWAAEMAISRRRSELKVCLLDLVAPSKKFALFLTANDTSKSNTNDAKNSNNNNSKIAAQLGLARTLALLIMGSGDPNREVSERAKAYLKAYKDSQRGKLTENQKLPLLPVPLLSMELLSLCLGQVHAEAALLSTGGSTNSMLLGPPARQQGPNISQQLVLATKRRPVSESYFGVMVDFVAKLLEDNPQAFLSEEGESENNNHRDESSSGSIPHRLVALHKVAALAVRVARTKLVKNSNASFSGLTTLRAKPLISTTLLLQAVAMRVTLYLENSCKSVTTSNDGSQTTTATLLTLLAQSLALACSVLSDANSNVTPTSFSTLDSNHLAFHHEGTWAVRDACYGIVCTLSRCKLFVLAPEGYMFSCGEVSSLSASGASTTFSSSRTSSTPTQTVKLLFGCATNEMERLRPRAVAALDALLGAYVWVYVTDGLQRTATSDLAPMDYQTDLAAGTANSLHQGSLPSPSLGSSAITTASSGMQVDGASLARSLIPLLWNAAQPYQTKASRVAAARWASDLLKQVDLVSACHLLCFLAGDSDATAASIAVDGLGVSNCHLQSDGILSPLVKTRLPAFSEIVRAIFPRPVLADASDTGRLQRYWDFSLRGKATSLRFGILCLVNELYDADNEAMVTYLSAISETLLLYKGPLSDHALLSIDLLDDSSACLLSLLTKSQFVRARVLCGEMVLILGDIEALALRANSAKARRSLALACGRLYEAFEFWDNLTSRRFGAWVSECRFGTSLPIVLRGLQAVESSGAATMTIHGCAYLGASIARAVRMSALRSPILDDDDDGIWDDVGLLVTLLGHGTLHSDEVIGNACSDGLATAVSFDGLDAPILRFHLYKPCSVALTELTKALTKYGNGDFIDCLRTTRLAHASGVCLAATSAMVELQETNGATTGLRQSRIACSNALFGLLGSSSFRKDEEIGLIVGEALALYADSVSSQGVIWNSDCNEWPFEYSEEFAMKLPPHQHVLYFLLNKLAKSSSPHEKNACPAALLAVVARAASWINKNPLYSQRPLAVALGLRLENLQEVFIQLLSDPKLKHFSRECCCLGLAACRGIAGAINSIDETGEKSSDAFNKRLLRAFGQSTNIAGSAFMETAAQAAERRAAENNNAPSRGSLMEIFGDEDVGGASGISEAALGAYREMAAASVALGRHDILYGLLVLSVSHSCWSDEGLRDRYSPQALLGEDVFAGCRVNSSEIRLALSPYLGKLIPRILRARHDPNKHTRDQMTALWNGITGGGAEARFAVSQHLLSTLDALIIDATSKLWRSRVGACGALAEILSGRTWDDLGGGGPVISDDLEVHESDCVSAGVRLLRLWRVTVRALDDVRGAVRDVGATLGRAVRSLTIRLCDLSTGAERGIDDRAKLEKHATAASATSLSWLIKHGLGQQCDEAAGVCISALVEVVGVAKPVMLGPILPDLLRSLLIAISGLEPAALNFLQLRTGDQEGLERIRLQLAQSGPLAAAVTKCVELLPSTDMETQHAVVAQLDSALRMSSGFATRAAVADCVSSLCSSCPSAFRFPYTSSGNPSVRLLRALYFASERERTSAAKDKMVHALGNLAALCPGASIRALALRACERYNQCTGNNDDSKSRKAAASCIRAIALRASEQFADGGNADVWRTKVLPVAFVGRMDVDKEIATLWQDVWNELGSSAGQSDHDGSHQSFGTRIEEVLLPFLVKESTHALQDVSWARRTCGARALRELCEAGILAPVLRANSSATTPVNDLPRARYRANASNIALRECVNVISKPRLWTGKSLVLQAAVEIASKWAAAEVCKDKDGSVLYGWEDELARTCPWKPISFKRGPDLFVGDDWFQQPSVTTVYVDDTEGWKEEDQPNEMEVDADAASFQIDFSEVDTEDGKAFAKTSDSGDTPATLSTPLSFIGFFRLLLIQATQNSLTISDEYLPYRVAALQGLQSLMNSLPGADDIKSFIYNHFSCEILVTVITSHDTGYNIQVKSPPVVVAGALDVLASTFWNGMGSKEEEVSKISKALAADDMLELLEASVGSHAWTVREASASCLASLASVCNSDWLRQHRVISTFVHGAAEVFKDRKFWKVRLAAIRLLQSLLNRVGDRPPAEEEKQLILEAILPYKEDILRVFHTSLKDSEAQIHSVASNALMCMSWWP